MRRHFGGAIAARVSALALILAALALTGGVEAASIADSRVDGTAMGDWLPPAAPAPAAPQVVVVPPAQEVMLPVVAGIVAPGETITDAMLMDKAFPAHVTSQYPVAVSRAQLVGKVARRVLMAGHAVPVAAVGDAKLVTRGVATELRFEQDGLLITAVGVPLDSATAGTMVRLKNLDSGKIVTGVVQPDGSVKVGGQ